MQSFGDVASMTDCGILDQTLVSVQTFIAMDLWVGVMHKAGKSWCIELPEKNFDALRDVQSPDEVPIALLIEGAIINPAFGDVVIG